MDLVGQVSEEASVFQEFLSCSVFVFGFGFLMEYCFCGAVDCGGCPGKDLIDFGLCYCRGVK